MKQNGLYIRYWIAALALGAAFWLGALGVQVVHGGRTPGVVTAANTGPAGRASFEDGFSPVIHSILPAVVNVASSRIVRLPEEGTPFFSDPWFQQFFGKDFSRQFRVPREQRERSLGSGVILSPDGYILTNNHVVEKATEVRISRANQREFKARVIGTDSQTDIAVLKIDEKNLPVMAIGDSSKVRVGEFALAIGDPFGVGQTVTMGIVSATGRGGFGIEDIEDFIQTDAAVNPGNSGGALVNVRGELIGINTAIVSGGGGNQGVGFAVPVNMARSVMEQIVKTGRVVRGWLGVVIQPVTPTVAKAFRLPGEPRGALVGDLAPDGPAAHAGIEKGDLILEVNGQPILESRDFQLKVTTMSPGAQLTLKLFRNGTEREVLVALGELPIPKAASVERHAPSATPGHATLEGLTVNELTPQIARQIEVPITTPGVVVSDIEPGSLAADAGLQTGDVIQEVNRKPVRNVVEFESAARQAGREAALLLVNRAGTTLFLVVEAS